MSLTTIITVNAILDLAVVLAVFAIVRLVHRHHEHESQPETLHPSRPIPLRLVLSTAEAKELHKAA